MSTTTITRRYAFCAGHRVYQHESKCKNLHGHNYAVSAVATANKLDDIGRVIDFAVLKEKFEGWIDKNWDHGFLWFKKDPVCEGMFRSYAPSMDMKNFRCDFNPTAENMAQYLLEVVAPELMKGTGVLIVAIELEETEKCKAMVSL